MHRRMILSGFLGSILAAVPGIRIRADDTIEMLQRNWRELLAPGEKLPDASEALFRSNDDWRMFLEREQYQVLRREATERPYTSPFNGEHREGVYVCVACDLPLFTSAMKFESGTGWPSFFTTISGAFERKRDFLLIIPRSEYHCVRCGGHHGHIFADGPAPTNERWCNNGVALRFIPRNGDV